MTEGLAEPVVGSELVQLGLERAYTVHRHLERVRNLRTSELDVPVAGEEPGLDVGIDDVAADDGGGGAPADTVPSLAAVDRSLAAAVVGLHHVAAASAADDAAKERCRGTRTDRRPHGLGDVELVGGDERRMRARLAVLAVVRLADVGAVLDDARQHVREPKHVAWIVGVEAVSDLSPAGPGGPHPERNPDRVGQRPRHQNPVLALDVAERRTKVNAAAYRPTLSYPVRLGDPLELPFAHRQHDVQNEAAGVGRCVEPVLHRGEYGAGRSDAADRLEPVKQRPTEALGVHRDQPAGLSGLDAAQRGVESGPLELLAGLVDVDVPGGDRHAAQLGPGSDLLALDVWRLEAVALAAGATADPDIGVHRFRHGTRASKYGQYVAGGHETRHNLAAYDEAGLDSHHVPVARTEDGAEALEELLPLLRRETRPRGALAIHGDRHTDFVAAVCAAHLHDLRAVDPAQALAVAAEAGLTVTAAACALIGVRPGEVAALRRVA